jgi:hypothetical protein
VARKDGREPVKLVLTAEKLTREAAEVNESGITHGWNGLLSSETICREDKPEKKLGGIEVNLLLWRSRLCKSARLEMTGSGPDREFDWSSSLVKPVRFATAGERVPVSLRLPSWMALTRPSEEHVSPDQFPQGSDPVQSSTPSSLATACMAGRSEAAMSTASMEERLERRQRRRTGNMTR